MKREAVSVFSDLICNENILINSSILYFYSEFNETLRLET